ncbi:hypothetical protein [Shewanella algae]|uniref:hypothetical protein n=1 Tax=Shewanella algae TaxID=38313 RepID=UPI001BEE9EBE|nr:hypothetical protein [Shewanella algae]BCV28479.1 hypothetical protein TUM3811_23390 [Shewanella algae]
MAIIDWDTSRFPIHDLSTTSNNPVYRNTSLNLKTTTRPRNLNQIQLDFTTTVGGFTEAKALQAYVNQLTNGKNQCLIRLGGIFANPNVTTVNATVAANTGADHISLTSNEMIEAGSYFNIPNDNKLYQVINDIQVGEVEIWPPLRKPLVNGAPLGFTSPYLVGEVSSNAIATEHTNQGLIVTVQLTIMEVL